MIDHDMAAKADRQVTHATRHISPLPNASVVNLRGRPSIRDLIEFLGLLEQALGQLVKMDGRTRSMARAGNDVSPIRSSRGRRTV